MGKYLKKSTKRLDARVKSYIETMLVRRSGGFKKPGSMKKIH